MSNNPIASFSSQPPAYLPLHESHSTLDGHLIDPLQLDHLDDQSVEVKISESTSPIFKPANGETVYFLAQRLENMDVQRELAATQPQTANEENEAPIEEITTPTLSACAASATFSSLSLDHSSSSAFQSPEVGEEEQVHTPTLSSCASSSAFSTPSVFSLYESSSSAFQSPLSALQSPEVLEEPLPPLAERKSYFFAYAARVQTSYLSEGYPHFPHETTNQLDERFERIEKKLGSAPEQRSQNRAIFAYLQEIISINRLRVQALCTGQKKSHRT